MSFNQATMKTTELIFFLYSLANSLQNSTMFNINSYLFSTLIALEKKNHESVSHDQHGLFKPSSQELSPYPRPPIRIGINTILAL